MQRLQVKLVDTLAGNKAHGGTLHCLSHGFSVAEVVLLALEEGFTNCAGTSAILNGNQPPELTARKLMDDTRLPLDWNEQRRALGFA